MLCATCKIKSTCQEICKKVNSFLKSKGIYSSDYIRKRRENPMDNQSLDIASARRAVYLKYGRRLESD